MLLLRAWLNRRSLRVPAQRNRESLIDSATALAPAAQATPMDQSPFRAVADYTYDWESWHGTDGRLNWVNPAVERITGYSVGECLAMDDYPSPMVAEEHREARDGGLRTVGNRSLSAMA